MVADELALRRDRLHRVGQTAMRSVKQCHVFLADREVVLESGRAAIPSLADAVAGRRLTGSWMANPENGLIYRLLDRIDEDEFPHLPLVQGKQTYVCRRLAPFVNRIATDAERCMRAVAGLRPSARSLLAAVSAGPV